jgi:GntR family transcriptional regulator
MAEVSSARDTQRTHRARRARDLVREDVLSGRWGSGPLPPEPELGKLLACSRNVVRDALNMLVAEGILVRVPGAGTFTLVRKETHQFHVLNGLGELSAADEAAERGATRYEVRTLEVVPAPRRVAESLQVPDNSSVILLERVTVRDGHRVALWTTYLRHDLAGDLLRPDFTAQLNLYQIVEQLGLALGTSQVRTEAVVADGAVGEILGVPAGHPLILIRRVLFLADGRPVDTGTGYLRGDRVVLEHRLSRPETL